MNLQSVKRSFLRSNLSKIFRNNAKPRWISQFKNIFNLKTLVETGTYIGETVNYFKDSFDTIYSIELSEMLAKEATHRFKNNSNVHILQGDSGLLLGEIVQKLSTPTLFWLDAHYSAGITSRSTVFLDTPIAKELEVIFSKWIEGSVILIDDARLFVGADNYPTLNEVEAVVEKTGKKLRVLVANDIIHIF